MTARRAGGQLVLALGWTVGVSVLFLLVIYPALQAGWPRTIAQVTAYAVIVLPVFALRPAVALPLGGSRSTAVIAVALIASATLFAALVEHESVDLGLRHAVAAISAGVGEELVFRGLVRARLGALVPGARMPVVVARVVLGAALFAGYHLPVVLIEGDSVAALLSPFGFGLLLATLRELTGGLGLPAAVHVAIDLSS